MASAEKYAWASLIALAAIYFFFQMRLLAGWGVADVSAEELFWVYITVIVLSIISEGIIVAVFEGKSQGAIEKDERDLLIEAKANGAEHLFLVAAINIFLFHVIADAAFENHIFPRVDVADLTTLVFILFSVLFAGEAIKRLFTIYYYRTGTAG